VAEQQVLRGKRKGGGGEERERRNTNPLLPNQLVEGRRNSNLLKKLWRSRFFGVGGEREREVEPKITCIYILKISPITYRSKKK
jgi:hypothetical protein